MNKKTKKKAAKRTKVPVVGKIYETRWYGFEKDITSGPFSKVRLTKVVKDKTYEGGMRVTFVLANEQDHHDNERVVSVAWLKGW